MTSDAQNAFNPQNPLALVSQARGLSLDDVKEEGSSVLDFFTGVSQQEAAARDPAFLASLSRSDRISLLVDGSTPSILGTSPWSIGLQLDASVASQIHALNGSTLVFSFGSTLIDLAESKVRSVRYALVWDDSTVAEIGTVDLDVLGTTFLVVGVSNEPTGQQLTLWITDNDLVTRIVQQGSLQDIDKIRQGVIGKLGAAANPDTNPLTAAFNVVSTYLATSAAGGVLALAIIGVVLVMVVRSEAFKDVAKTAAKVV